jgi:flagellin-like protein
MRGLSEIFTMIMMVMIVVGVSTMFWLYVSGYFSNMTISGKNTTQSALQDMSTCMRIEESFQNKFFIRNCGRGVIDEVTLSVYVDEDPVGFVQSPSVINEGKSGSLTISSSILAGQHTLKVINVNSQTTISFTSDGAGKFRII